MRAPAGVTTVGELHGAERAFQLPHPPVLAHQAFPRLITRHTQMTLIDQVSQHFCGRTQHNCTGFREGLVTVATGDVEHRLWLRRMLGRPVHERIAEARVVLLSYRQPPEPNYFLLLPIPPF